MKSGQELYREILMLYLRDAMEAREEAKRAERKFRDYLNRHKLLKPAYEAFMQSGGGTVEELKQWLASYRSVPTLSQKKHMRLVATNERGLSA